MRGERWGSSSSRLGLTTAFPSIPLRSWPSSAESKHATRRTLAPSSSTAGQCSLLSFCIIDTLYKVPLLWVIKVHILVLGVPNNRLTCMQDQKTLSLSYNMHVFLLYLLNDFQTSRSTLNFSKPLLCVMLICTDWSPFHLISPVMPDKAVFVSAVLLCVQRLCGNVSESDT